MTEKELMLGDWVRRRYTTTSGREVINDFQITAIEKMTGSYYVWSEKGRECQPEQLEPIPITAEILRKNGWKWDGLYATRIEDNALIEYYKYEGILRNYYLHKGGADELVFLSRPGVVYIHQLQHALRLCGIKKEIEL